MMTSTEILVTETSVFNVDMDIEKLESRKSTEFYQIPSEAIKAFQIQQHFT
jgi:hypothetical protein